MWTPVGPWCMSQKGFNLLHLSNKLCLIDSCVFCCRQIWTLLHVPLVFILTGLYSCSLFFEQENNYLHVELTLINLFIIVLVNNTYN
jgi:uncharacterized membrane protein